MFYTYILATISQHLHFSYCYATLIFKLLLRNIILAFSSSSAKFSF